MEAVNKYYTSRNIHFSYNSVELQSGKLNEMQVVFHFF